MSFERRHPSIVTLTSHTSKYEVQKYHQRYIFITCSGGSQKEEKKVSEASLKPVRTHART